MELTKKFDAIIDILRERNLKNNTLTLPLDISVEEIQSIKDLIANGLNINENLKSAILYGNLELIELFLSQDINIVENPEYMATWLELSRLIEFDMGEDTILVKSSIDYQKNIIDLFLKHGEDINELIGEEKISLLWLACLFSDIEIIEYLIELGANIHIKINNISLLAYILLLKNTTSNTPLKYSIQREKDILKLLLRHGADVNELIEINKKEKMTLLHLACLISDIEIIEYLIELGADIHTKIDDTNLLFFILEMSKNTLEGLNHHTILNFNYEEWTKKRYEIAKVLIQHGMDINYAEEGFSFLSLYIQKNSKYVEVKGTIVEKEASRKLNKSKAEHIEMVKFLIDNGADINLKNEEGYPPICMASSNNNIEMVQLLLESGADVNACHSLLKKTALMSASSNNNLPMVQLLLEYKANTHMEDILNTNACSMSNNRKIIKLLTMDGEKRDREKYEIHKEIKEEIFRIQNEKVKKIKLELNKIEERKLKQKTPMSEILSSKDTDRLDEIIDRGYDVSHIDIYDLIFDDFPIGFIEKILINGADVNAVNYESKMSPLILATDKNSIENVQLLIKHGADVTYKMPNGEEAFDFATSDEIEALLLNVSNSQNNPQALVETLTNFTIDTPIKYTTHSWDFGSLKNEYGDFQGFINKVKNQWTKIQKDLKELSPDLHTKIYNFLLNESASPWCSKSDSINMGWSSLDGLEEWCNEGHNPYSFKLEHNYDIDGKTLSTFGDIIGLFKKEIEIRNENNMLEYIFMQQKKKLGRTFKVELIKLKGRSFYTDVEKFKLAIEKMFDEIKKRDLFNISVEVIERNSESIDIMIVQESSEAGRSAKDMLDEIKNGDFKMLKDNLKNLCDWSIESSYEDKGYRVNYLRNSNSKEIEKLNYIPQGFTHILRFYK